MNTRPFTALIDMDGPLFLWEEGLVGVARQMFPHIVTPDAGTRLEWNLLKGLNEEETAAIIEVMNLPGFYRNLEPVPGAAQALNEMLEAGIEVFLASTPSLDNPTCASDKLAALDEHFGREISHRTILTQDKTLLAGDVLVDDKPVITGAHTPMWTHIIYDLAYNQDAPGPRLYDWANWRDLPELALLTSEEVAA